MTTKENYNRWLNSSRIDAQTREQLLKMSQEEIDDAFFKDVEVFEVIMPYVWLAALVGFGLCPWTALLTLLSLPVAIGNARTMLSYSKVGIEAIARLDERTAQLQLLFSVLLMGGLALSLLIL